MVRWVAVIGVALALLAAGSAQEKKPPEKLKGRLPPNFGKLGLSEEQRQQIYKIQDDFDRKIEELQAQIKKLRADRDKAIEAVLTDTQRKVLEELRRKKPEKGKAADKPPL
ncbi:MAG: hypothetical protein C4297_11295 [Gemmataceae bacterium]